MADEEERQTNETSEAAGTEEKTGAKLSVLPWILLGTIVPVFAGTGFFLGKIMAQGEDVPETKVVQAEKPIYEHFLNPEAAASPTWIYEVAPFVSNLRDPGARRFVRVGFSLEMSAQLDPVKGKEYLDSKKAFISNRLDLYFGDKLVEDLQGERNRRTVLAEVDDILNELLFKDAKPPIVSVLFGECTIQ